MFALFEFWISARSSFWMNTGSIQWNCSTPAQVPLILSCLWYHKPSWTQCSMFVVINHIQTLGTVNQYCSHLLQKEQEADITCREKGETCQPAVNRTPEHESHKPCKFLHSVAKQCYCYWHFPSPQKGIVFVVYNCQSTGINTLVLQRKRQVVERSHPQKGQGRSQAHPVPKGKKGMEKKSLILSTSVDKLTGLLLGVTIPLQKSKSTTSRQRSRTATLWVPSPPGILPGHEVELCEFVFSQACKRERRGKQQ